VTTALQRCSWVGNEPIYITYHDKEWGVPNGDSRALFEKMILEGFQSGLSWITILRKRDHFRRVFDNFDAEKIARYEPQKIEALLADPGIIRNRLKIEATIDNARALLKLREKTTLARFLWDFVDGKPIQNRIAGRSDVMAQTPLSTQISKSLRKEGFRFVGPTTVYAMMQAVGMVNDHTISCYRHDVVSKLLPDIR
jgi:DNA-3-methyladenine glycosylase I